MMGSENATNAYAVVNAAVNQACRQFPSKPMYQMSAFDKQLWRSNYGREWTACAFPHGYERFRDQFHAVLDQALYPASWLDAQVYSGIFHFMASENAAIVFEVKVYPSGARDVHGLIAAGDLAEIRDVLIPQAEEWGRSHGCIGGLIESREGWAKALKSSGYAPFQLSIRKVL